MVVNIMSLINNPEALQTYINEKIRRALDPVAAQADFHIDIALKRYMIKDSAEWNKLSNDVISSHLDMDEAETEELASLHERLDTLVEKIVSEVKGEKKVSATDRSATQRLINDYFLPNLLEAHNNTSAELGKINQKLVDDPKNAELLQYKAALTSNAAYLDSLAALPFALEKMMAARKDNLGHNYTPRKNAQVLASLLDTVQKSQEGASWTAKALLKAVKLASKATMPDLPADAFTLDTIRDLLPYVNNIIDNGKELQLQKDTLFPKDAPKKADARKELLKSMGIEFNSLTTICQNTLVQPAKDALHAAGSLWNALGTVSTEDGLDYLRTLSTLDQIGDMLHGMPEELVPTSLKQFSDYYQTAKEKVGQAAGYVTSGADYLSAGAGYVASGLNSMGSMAYKYTPDSVKSAAGAVADTAADIVARTAISVGPAISKAASTVEYIVPATAVGRWIPFLTKQTLINFKDRIVNAAAEWVPASIKERMTPQTPESSFWKAIKPEGAIEIATAEAYLSFHELVAASGSPSLEEDFFQSYMKKNGIPASYEDYTALKQKLSPETLSTPLNELRTSFEAEENQENRFDVTLYMLHRLKNLESQAGQSQNVDPILNELTEALHYKSADAKTADFQTIYVRPALERAVLAHEQKQFGPLLEKELDLDGENTKLRQIYSKLKGSQILSNKDLWELTQFSQSSADIKFSVAKSIEDVTAELEPAIPPAEVAKALTPKEESRESAQAMLDNTLAPICRHISEGFQKQLDACERLRELCPNDPLKSLCDSKIAYLHALQQCNTKLLDDMKPGGKLAEQVRMLTTEEATTDMLKMPDAMTMAKQLMHGTWDVKLPKGTMTDAGMSEKILAYALSNNEYLQGIVEARHDFDKTLNATPPPAELMVALGSPLSNIVKTEGLARKGAAVLVGAGKDYFIEPLATYYIASTALSFVFPQALIAEIAVGVLTRPSVQEHLGKAFQPVTDLIKPITAPVTEFIGQQQQKLTESVKDYLCPMLNIEVQKILEQKAFEYASSDPAARSTMVKGERDSFSGFYLQYRAIQKNNPSLDKKDCINYLFKGFLEGKEPAVQNNIIERFSKEYEKLDNVFSLQDVAAEDLQNTGELEQELKFFMDNIDFDAPDEAGLVTMSIYNRLIMMQLDAAKHLNEVESKKLEQKALGVLESVLKKLESADENVDSTDLSNARTHVRAEPLLPATQRVTQIKLEELQKKLSGISELIDSSVKDRVDQLNSEEPRFGQSVLENEYAKSTKTNLAYKIGRAISRVATPVIVWASVGMAIASQGIVPAILTALGVASATAGAVATGGLAIAGAVLLGRIAYTTAKEVRARSKEFEAISKSDASPIKKFGLRALEGLKCFGKGLVRAVMVDTLYAKVSSFFTRGIKPIADEAQNLRQLARVYPTQDVLTAEKNSLSELQGELKTLKDLVEAQVKDKKIVAKEAGGYGITLPKADQFTTYDAYRKSLQTHADIDVRAVQIEEKAKDIQSRLQHTYELLQQPSNDARWVLGVNQQLDQYKEAFTRLTEVMEQVNLVEKVGRKMRPEMRDYEKAVKQAQTHLDLATKAVEALQGEKRNAFFDALKGKTSVEMEQVASELQVRVAAISEAASQVDHHAKRAIQIVNQAGGEVGVFTAMIDGPATTAQREARQVVQNAAEIEAHAKEFLAAVEHKIAIQRAIEAQNEVKTMAPTITTGLEGSDSLDSGIKEDDSEEETEFFDAEEGAGVPIMDGDSEEEAEFFDAEEEIEIPNEDKSVTPTALSSRDLERKNSEDSGIEEDGSEDENEEEEEVFDEDEHDERYFKKAIKDVKIKVPSTSSNDSGIEEDDSPTFPHS